MRMPVPTRRKGALETPLQSPFWDTKELLRLHKHHACHEVPVYGTKPRGKVT